MGTLKKNRSGNEMILTARDEKDDIPFVYLKLKEGTEAEKKAASEEWDWLLDQTKRVSVNPRGKTLEGLIVCVRHDKAIHIAGSPPKGAMLAEVKKLCKKAEVAFGLDFGRSQISSSHSLLDLPWKRETPKKKRNQHKDEELELR
jgi:hypothetical protein